jgi:hypothetical protein
MQGHIFKSLKFTDLIVWARLILGFMFNVYTLSNDAQVHSVKHPARLRQDVKELKSTEQISYFLGMFNLEISCCISLSLVAFPYFLSA